jgi:hypothetical protein
MKAGMNCVAWNSVRDYAYPLSQRAWAVTGRAGEQAAAEVAVRRRLRA